jgi:hypothetical protein
MGHGRETDRDKDWYPWRFRRHLSLMARPVVDLGNGTVVYAPGFCEDGFRQNVMEAFQGAFDTEYFSTDLMKKYYGGVNDKRGADFNAAASVLFTSQGWTLLRKHGSSPNSSLPLPNFPSPSQLSSVGCKLRNETCSPMRLTRAGAERSNEDISVDRGKVKESRCMVRPSKQVV